MPICTNCGQQNPDHTVRCIKCGSSVAGQMRSQQDSSRSRTGTIFRAAMWAAGAIALAIVGPPTYRTGNAAYQKYKFDKVNNRAMIDCNGPITDSMQSFQKDEINKCLANNTDLGKAQAAYDAFTKANNSK